MFCYCIIYLSFYINNLHLDFSNYLCYLFILKKLYLLQKPTGILTITTPETVLIFFKRIYTNELKNGLSFIIIRDDSVNNPLGSTCISKMTTIVLEFVFFITNFKGFLFVCQILSYCNTRSWRKRVPKFFFSNVAIVHFTISTSCEQHLLC